MKTFSYAPQSYRWSAYTVLIPEEMEREYLSPSGVFGDLMVANDGNTTLVRVVPGSTWVLQELIIDGSIAVVRGEGKIFLASRGSWSGGSRFHGAIALKPGAIVRLGAKGCWSYLVADEGGIRQEKHDPRLFEDQGGDRWQPLA